ncbi:MAG TPA: nucleotide pyrophosphohydrolase [Victivallales bacterium]|nr:nucleotide pyrophosphohydrolase [Victivallales bacterium]
MDIDILKKKIKQFSDDRNWEQFHSPKNLSMALIVEAAELVEQFQWLTENESLCLDEDKLSNVRDEIADILIYLIRLSDRLKIDILEAASDKLKKNAIKYPKNKSFGKSSKYNEL